MLQQCPTYFYIKFLVKERLPSEDGSLCIMKVCSALNLHLVKQRSQLQSHSGLRLELGLIWGN